MSFEKCQYLKTYIEVDEDQENSEAAKVHSGQNSDEDVLVFTEMWVRVVQVGRHCRVPYADDHQDGEVAQQEYVLEVRIEDKEESYAGTSLQMLRENCIV